MPNVEQVLKAEIRRVTRKELRVTGVKHLSGLATIVSPVLLMVFVPLR